MVLDVDGGLHVVAYDTGFPLTNPRRRRRLRVTERTRFAGGWLRARWWAWRAADDWLNAWDDGAGVRSRGSRGIQPRLETGAPRCAYPSRRPRPPPRRQPTIARHARPAAGAGAARSGYHRNWPWFCPAYQFSLSRHFQDAAHLSQACASPVRSATPRVCPDTSGGLPNSRGRLGPCRRIGRCPRGVTTGRSVSPPAEGFGPGIIRQISAARSRRGR
jgi:hypothetical protein